MDDTKPVAQAINQAATELIPGMIEELKQKTIAQISAAGEMASFERAGGFEAFFGSTPGKQVMACF